MPTNIQQFEIVTRPDRAGNPVQVMVQRDWFVYSLTVASIANGATSVSTINIQADANFILQKITGFADIGGAVQTVDSQVIPLLSLQLTDSGSGRNLFQPALNFAAICGPNLAGYALPLERCFTANSNISGTFTNYSAGTTYANVYVSLHGYKEWIISKV